MRIIPVGKNPNDLTFYIDGSKAELQTLASKAFSCLAREWARDLPSPQELLEQAEELRTLEPWASVPDAVMEEMPKKLQAKVKEAREAFKRAGVKPGELEAVIERLKAARPEQAIALAVLDRLNSLPAIELTKTVNEAKAQVEPETGSGEAFPFDGDVPRKGHFIDAERVYGPQAQVAARVKDTIRWYPLGEVVQHFPDVLRGIASECGWEGKVANFARAFRFGKPGNRYLWIRK